MSGVARVQSIKVNRAAKPAREGSQLNLREASA